MFVYNFNIIFNFTFYNYKIIANILHMSREIASSAKNMERNFSRCDTMFGLTRTMSAGRRNVAHLSDCSYDTSVASRATVLIIF